MTRRPVVPVGRIDTALFPARFARAPLLAWLALSAALAGCVNLAPEHVRPNAPVRAAWPQVLSPVDAVGSTTAACPRPHPNPLPQAGEGAKTPSPPGTGEKVGARGPCEAAPAAAADWQTFITDDRLRRVVQASLDNNRDLRVAASRIEQAQAQYRIEESAWLPEVGGTASATRSRTPSGNGGSATRTTQYRVELGLSGFELDFFGRVRNLSEAALQSFFEVQENQRSVRTSLVAQVAGAWLALSADAERLQLARGTLQSQRASYDLTRRTHELGGTSGLVLAQAQTTVDAARGEVARYTALVAQDRNALELLVGAGLPDDLLPAGAVAAPASAAAAEPPPPPPATQLVEVPAGLPSEVLLRRPDVVAAEFRLRAAEADIGAARAAFFPRISLTAAAGTQSGSLSGLFSGGSGAWRFVPQIDLPIFDAGARRASLRFSQAQRDIEVATYEKTVQAAFREVADALAQRATLAEQLDAQQSVVLATQRTFQLSEALFKNGASSYLDVLDAQRALYAARQSAINLRLSEQLNRVTLYKALGGG